LLLSKAVDEGGDRGAAVDAASPDAVVWYSTRRGTGDGLHLLEDLEPGAAALDAEMLVEKRAMPALDNAV
jgi:hypothetical protein